MHENNITDITLAAKAHQLIGHLRPGQLADVVHLVEVMSDPVTRAAQAALPDEEAVTDEDRIRFREGQQWFEKRDGKGLAMDEVLLGLGLKREDFPA